MTMRIPLMGVYAIYGGDGNSAYVGSSGDMMMRVRNHFYSLKSRTHHNLHLQRAYDKHGPDWFDWDILEQCLMSPWRLEQEWLNRMREWYRLYNMDDTAARAYPLFVPQETRQKIAATIKGQKRSQETRDRIRAALTGKPHTQERTAKWRKSMEGKWGNPNSLAAMAAAIYRVSIPQETQSEIIRIYDSGLSSRKTAAALSINISWVRKVLKQNGRMK